MYVILVRFVSRVLGKILSRMTRKSCNKFVILLCTMDIIKSVQAVCDDIFGCISPPVNCAGCNNVNPAVPIGNLFTVIIQLVITAAAILTLGYLLWGGFDWITSGGEKDKIVKAQQKITYALIGIIFVMLSFGIFGVIAGNVLRIIKIQGGAIIFSIPKLGP